MSTYTHRARTGIQISVTTLGVVKLECPSTLIQMSNADARSLILELVHAAVRAREIVQGLETDTARALNAKTRLGVI